MSETVAGLVGALVGAALTWFLGIRKIQSEHITKERGLWRSKMRSMAIELCSMPVPGSLWVQLQTNLNPHDVEEQKLVELAYNFKTRRLSDADARWAAKRIADMLKFDWERAKNEASACHWRTSRRAQNTVDNLRHGSRIYVRGY